MKGWWERKPKAGMERKAEWKGERQRGKASKNLKRAGEADSGVGRQKT